MTERDELLLRPEAAAKLLGVGRTTVFALISSGELQSVRIGRLRRVPRSACQRYVERLQSAAAPSDNDVCPVGADPHKI